MRVRRRDRHGRGPRGPLLPREVPAYRTRAQAFDDAVISCLDELHPRWPAPIDACEFAVEEVPPSGPAPWEHGVPLARYFPPDAALPARVVLYRRPITERSRDAAEMAALINDVLVEQIAQITGRNPEEIDPGYRSR